MKLTNKQLETLLESEIDPAFGLRAGHIFRVIEKSKPKTILDAGCGRGFYANNLADLSYVDRVEAIDVKSAYINQAIKNCTSRKVHFQQASIFKLPFPNNSFDTIICSEILEHLTSDIQALVELKRVLKPNGNLLITVPNLNFPFFWDPLNWLLMRVFKYHISKDIWWLAGIWADHLRLYTLKDLHRLCQLTKFQIRETQYLTHHCWPFTHFLLYGIGKNLVEKFGATTFSRFHSQPSRLSKILAQFMRWPDSFPHHSSDSRSVVIFLHLSK